MTKRFLAFFSIAIFGACLLAFSSHSAFALNNYSLNVEKDFSQNAYHADSPTLSPSGAMTIESWVKFESLPVTGSSHTIVGKWTTSCCTRSYELFVYEWNGQYFLHSAISSNGSAVVGNYRTLDVPHAFTVGKWYHIAFVFMPSERMELFVDGVSIGSVTSGVPPGIHDNDAEFQIGADIDDTGPNNFFDGNLDEVRLWGVARSPLEILSSKDKELVGTEPGLLGYWNFNGTSADASASENHLTLRNNPTFDYGVVPFFSLFSRKSTDQALSNSAIPASDTELSVSIPNAGKTYIVHGVILASTTTAVPDMKFGLTTPPGVVMDVSYIASTGNDRTMSGILQSSGGSSGRIRMNGNDVTVIHIDGTIEVGINTGELTLLWSQQIASPVPIKVLRGSYLQVIPQ